jgi:hypothetical protein
VGVKIAKSMGNTWALRTICFLFYMGNTWASPWATPFLTLYLTITTLFK